MAKFRTGPDNDSRRDEPKTNLKCGPLAENHQSIPPPQSGPNSEKTTREETGRLTIRTQVMDALQKCQAAETLTNAIGAERPLPNIGMP